METFLIIVWIVAVFVEAAIHEKIISAGNRPNYLQWFVIRGMAAIVHGICWDVENWLDYGPLLAFQLTSHMAIFNPALNYLRQKDFFYLGEDSGPIDRFFNKRKTLYQLFWTICVYASFYLVYKLL